MTTPFPDFVRKTTLVFAVPTGELTQDEVGNAIAETSSIRVTATLKVKTLTFSNSKIQRAPAIDESALLLKGCL